MSERTVPPAQSARLMLLDTYGLVYRALLARGIGQWKSESFG